MKGIIFVLHGRRHKMVTTNVGLLEKIATQSTNPSTIGFLEGENQTLEHAIEEMFQQEVEEIVFMPILLFPATHAKEDLPQRAKAYIDGRKSYRILETLGTTKAIQSFIAEQVTTLGDSKKEVLLIAHGTPHYEEPYQQLVEVARVVEQEIGRKVYATQHLGEANYLEFLATHPEPMIIQRLFLSEGYLAKKIKGAIEEVRGDKDSYLPTLQDQAALVNAIMERLVEAKCIQS